MIVDRALWESKQPCSVNLDGMTSLKELQESTRNVLAIRLVLLYLEHYVLPSTVTFTHYAANIQPQCGQVEKVAYKVTTWMLRMQTKKKEGEHLQP
jgi:hypothetical protein